MEPIYVTFILNALLGLVCLFLTTSQTNIRADHASLKEEIKGLRDEANGIKEKYYKKEDFNDFKKDLWARLDKMEDDFRHQIQELKQ